MYEDLRQLCEGKKKKRFRRVVFNLVSRASYSDKETPSLSLLSVPPFLPSFRELAKPTDVEQKAEKRCSDDSVAPLLAINNPLGSIIFCIYFVGTFIAPSRVLLFSVCVSPRVRAARRAKERTDRKSDNHRP